MIHVLLSSVNKLLKINLTSAFRRCIKSRAGCGRTARQASRQLVKVDGRADGRIDGRTDGQTEVHTQL